MPDAPQPPSPKPKAKPDQRTQIGEDLATISDILERAEPMVHQGKYSTDLSKAVKAMKQVIRSLKKHLA